MNEKDGTELPVFPYNFEIAEIFTSTTRTNLFPGQMNVISRSLPC